MPIFSKKTKIECDNHVGLTVDNDLFFKSAALFKRLSLEAEVVNNELMKGNKPRGLEDNDELMIATNPQGLEANAKLKREPYHTYVPRIKPLDPRSRKNLQNYLLAMFKISVLRLLFRDYPQLFADPCISEKKGITPEFLAEIKESQNNEANAAAKYLSKAIKKINFNNILQSWIAEFNIESQTENHDEFNTESNSDSSSPQSGGSNKKIRKQKNKKTKKISRN